ncbi:hypothetical protein HY441_00855 [Candidatus Microgenomates bacterium]|nr:hypothetical protein [Candidatus Microgenomates bacterium]
MKFKKVVLLNITKSALDKSYWSKIDKLVAKRVHLSRDSSKVRAELVDADCLLVNFGTLVTKEDIDVAPDLKYIGALATAFGKIDIDYAKRKGIPVTNLAGYSTEAVAEFTIAAILEHIRQLEEGKRRGRSGNYSEESISAAELRGSVFSVIGLGSIGRRVAELARGFDADVRYWSRTKKKVAGVKYQAADSLLKEADFLSINLAQTPETEGFLNPARVNRIKAGTVVINTAPMELVNVAALAKRLSKNDMTFILDHSDEMSEKDLKQLSKHKNCVIYPPIAYITKEARIAKQVMFVDNIESFLKGSPKNVVNI